MSPEGLWSLSHLQGASLPCTLFWYGVSPLVTLTVFNALLLYDLGSRRRHWERRSLLSKDSRAKNLHYCGIRRQSPTFQGPYFRLRHPPSFKHSISPTNLDPDQGQLWIHRRI